MLEKDYKLIYHARPFVAQLNSAHNKVHEAKRNAEQAEIDFRNNISTLTGIPVNMLDFDSRVVCMADGIGHHIYHMTKASGNGNKCVFCGCDDWDI